MDLVIRRLQMIADTKFQEAGQGSEVPLHKVASIAVIENPFASRFVRDLTPLIEASVSLGRTMARQAMGSFGSYEVQSYGKGGIVGVQGEQEHANALLTTAFAEPFREAIGGAAAWIPSMTKVAAPGALIDIPMSCKDEIYVRSHYDGMSIVVPDAPMPDEIVVIFAIANRGRLNARVGGLSHEEALKKRKGSG